MRLSLRNLSTKAGQLHRFLLDTNVVSVLATKHPDPHVVERFRTHQLEAAISAVVWNELLFGLQRLPLGKKRNELADFLFETVEFGLPILPYDVGAASWHAQERARLAAIGRTRPFADGTIAAVAAAQNLTLVTRNTKDFTGFEGLRVENWFENPAGF